MDPEKFLLIAFIVAVTLGFAGGTFLAVQIKERGSCVARHTILKNDNGTPAVTICVKWED